MKLSHVLVYSDEAATYQMIATLLPPDCIPTAVQDSSEIQLILARESIAMLVLALDRRDSIAHLTVLSDYAESVPVILIYPTDMKQDIAVLEESLNPATTLHYPLQPVSFRATIRRALRQPHIHAANRDREQALRKVNERLNQRLQELNTIYTVGKTVALSLDIEETLARAVIASVNLTNAEDGFIILSDGEELYLRVSANRVEAVPLFTKQRVSDRMVEQVLKSGRPAMLHRETKLATGVLVRALLYVPLHVPERGVIGVLGVVNRTGDEQFTEHQLFALSSVADFSAIAIENARLYTDVEAERSRLSAILGNTQEPIIVVDVEGKLWLWSQSATETFNIPPESQGKALKDVIENRLLLELFEQGSVAGLVAPVEIPVQDGRIFNTQLSNVPGMGSIAVLQDITDLKELDRLKTEFVSTVSHDLRSPLTTVQGYVSMLDHVGPLTDMQQSFIDKALASLDHITALISDLLDIGRIEAGYDLEMVAEDITVIVHQAIQHSRMLAETAQIQLECDIPDIVLTVWGNAKRLRQVLENLIGNAIKYNHPGGWVHVNAHMNDAYIVITIEDNGIGIPQEEIPRIWERFYRVQSPEAEDIRGTGLGLSIVESVVHKHNGRVWVNSEPGEGSTFTVMLPRHGPPDSSVSED